MTYSGALVGPGETTVPTLLDIALGLSRQPRFGGQARRWWSVLDHSLYAAELAARDNRSHRTILAVLLHDGHEALTGDVPTVLKTPDMREMQRWMDGLLADAYFPGGRERFDSKRVDVKQYDMRALVAEALLVGPPTLASCGSEEFTKHFGVMPFKKDCDVLRELLGESLVGREECIQFGVEAPNVREYVALCAKLRRSIEN
jgi:hypothetical protein